MKWLAILWLLLCCVGCEEEVDGQVLPPPSTGLSEARVLALPAFTTLRVVRDEQERVTCYVVQYNYSERSTAVSCLRDEAWMLTRDGQEPVIYRGNK